MKYIEKRKLENILHRYEVTYKKLGGLIYHKDTGYFERTFNIYDDDEDEIFRGCLAFKGLMSELYELLNEDCLNE